MKRQTGLLLAGFTLLVGGCNGHDDASGRPVARAGYPTAKTVAVTDDYHGTRVSDPYRWMEDESDPDLKSWIAAERSLADKFFDGLPGREGIEKRLTELWNVPQQGIPIHRGGYWFQTRNSGLQNQSVWYVMDSPDGAGRIILDPNTLSEDGTVALNSVSISKHGHYIAYATSQSGSDWQQWSVRDVASGKDLADHLEWSKFSGAAWTSDEAGFFYARYDQPAAGKALKAANYNQKLYFHKLNSAQADDTLVYARPDHKEWGFAPEVSDDGKFLVISVWKGTDSRNRLFYKDLRQPQGKVIALINELEARYDFIGSRGDTFILQTDLDAPRGRIIAIDVTHPEKASWQQRVAEQAQALQSAVIVNNVLSLRYLDAALSRLRLHKLDGSLISEIALPGKGTASNLVGEEDSDLAFLTFTSYLRPRSVYRFDFTAGALQPLWAPAVHFDPADFESEQVFYASKDGTRIPMMISHRKGLVKNGKNPTLLYGYGGFNIAITPRFSVMNLAWMEQGGIYAVANLRGGSEYGEAWHQAGSLHNKQNVFDDFIAAAEWLIAKRYTSREHLGIYGRSNGGLLIGAAMTQRPELFAVALPAVGVMDMLRFQKFTIGWAWTSDYGSSDDAEDFKVLYAYSPYHNLRKGTQYPPTMVMTADHDDRVVPYHSFKFGARLQADQAGDNPVILRIEHKAGHGGGKPTSKRIEEARDIIAFLAKYTGLTIH